MKAVLISIQPQWCEKIASGEKTIEVRKSVPKLPRPFKVYIYMTYGKTPKVISLPGKEGFEEFPLHNIHPDCANGKVIGEFMCRGIMGEYSPLLERQSCMTALEIMNYANGKRVYGWRIADLKIYDEPKELDEFDHPCEKGIADEDCKGCKYCFKGTTSGNIYCDRAVLTPPQSWCYVEAQK